MSIVEKDIFLVIYLNNKEIMTKDKNKKTNSISPVRNTSLTRDDLDIINELDYEDKKSHKPYDPYERHWDEA